MKIENPATYHFIMQDDLFLLKDDRALYIDPAPRPVIETPTISFNYLGGNKKNFLVITHYHNLDFIAENHLTALQSILKRMELDMADVAIFNKATYPDTIFGDLLDFFEPAKLLLLGASALPAGIEKPELNKPVTINNCNALFTFSFDEMMDNTENKKAFWEQLKLL